jgi:hypothetical protein
MTRWTRTEAPKRLYVVVINDTGEVHAFEHPNPAHDIL